jgi:hypothetical protein
VTVIVVSSAYQNLDRAMVQVVAVWSWALALPA